MRYKKRLVQRVFMVPLLIGVLGGSVKAESLDTSNRLQEPSMSVGSLVLTRKIYNDLGLPISGDVVVPEYVEYLGKEYVVKGIGEGLFSGNTDITSVTLPDSVIEIEAYAFDGCSNLKYVVMPEGLKSIGKASFQLCSSLSNLELPDTLEEISGYGFNHCSGVENEELTIGSHVGRLGDTVETPAHMFYDFGSDASFKSFSVSDDNSNYKDEEGILYSKDGSVLVSIPRGKTFENGVYFMPDTVKILGELAFSRNRNISRVVISDNLVIDSELSAQERWSYSNHGNDLSRSIYVYSPVMEYIVKETNERYKSIDEVIYSKGGRYLIAVPNGYNRDLRIPEGVKIWSPEALWSELGSFRGLILNEIPTISIPKSLEYIGEKQLKAINYMVDTYGTMLFVDGENKKFPVDEKGHLLHK